MKKFQVVCDFTAQSNNVRALMKLYGILENSDAKLDFSAFVVFIAFSIESYINSVGAKHLDIWDELERLPWKKKINILHRVTHQEPNWGIEPLQFATEVFSLRDKLAHGKTERVRGPTFSNPEDADEFARNHDFQPDWFSKINEQWARDAKPRFRALMTYLGGLFGEHESDHLLIAQAGVVEVRE